MNGTTDQAARAKRGDQEGSNAASLEALPWRKARLAQPDFRCRATLCIKGLQVGEGRPKIIAPTTSRTPEALAADAARLAAMPEVDMIEARLDGLGRLAPEAHAEALAAACAVAAGKPVLATLRDAVEGGAFEADDAYYEAVCRAAVGLGALRGPALIDLELFREPVMIEALAAEAHAQGMAVVISDHDFEGTPPEEEIVRRLLLEEKLGADILKIAVMAKGPEDALQLMAATAAIRRGLSEKPLLTMAMGKWGVVTRLAGEAFGADLTFASVGAASAPGQVPAGPCLAALETLHRAMNPQD